MLLLLLIPPGVTPPSPTYGGETFGGIDFGNLSTEASSSTPIFEDSWHQPWSLPSRDRFKKSVAIAKVAFAQFVTDPGVLVLPEKSSPDRWFVQAGEPKRTRRAIQTRLQQFAAFVEASPFTESVTADRWVPPLSEPVRRRPALATRLQQFFAFPEMIVTAERDRWMPPLGEPIRFRRSLKTSQQQFSMFVQGPPFSEAVPIDRWAQATNEPVRFRRRLPTSHQQWLIHVSRPILLTSETIAITIELEITAVPTSAFDQMLSDSRARFAYSAVISPWLLTDRGS